MGCLIHPSYFPNLAHFSIILNTEKLVFEIQDNYQKQTFRNRTEIYGANGKLTLTVPVIYTQKKRQLYKDVKIANDGNWQQLHLKSLQSAYSMSPFFEFYIDDLMPLFKNSFEYILDLNLKCFEILSDCLQLDLSIQFTDRFKKVPPKLKDFRHLINRNSGEFNFRPYTQVFTEKRGFISNLSILDLLFNEGPNTELYLNEQSLLQ